MSDQREGEIDVTHGTVSVVTLNRPDAKNAFTETMHHEFVDVMTRLDDAGDVRAIVLTGAGDAFSAGGSLADFEEKRLDLELRRRSLRVARRLVDEMLNIHVPIVAAVNGPAVGLGCTLVTLCDIVFMSRDAFLSDPHVVVGLVAGDGGAITWPHATSMLKVKQYLLTGDRITSDEALAMGMANFVVPREEILGHAVTFAERLSQLPSQAVQDTKQLLNQHLRQSATLALAHGLAAESQSHDTGEFAAISRRARADPPSRPSA